ncbi:hypothetical protein [Komagataeibacter xylinus]|nr:hypothetical protein [Komagataeibacter xylinus]
MRSHRHLHPARRWPAGLPRFLLRLRPLQLMVVSGLIAQPGQIAQGQT